MATLFCCRTFKWPSLSLQWRHNGRDSVSNHQTHDCLLNRLFRRRSKKTSKLRVTGLCAGNSPVTGEFPAQLASYAKNVSIRWRHHDLFYFDSIFTKVPSYGSIWQYHDDVIKWKHFPRNWTFVRGIHRSRWIPHTKASDAELWCLLWSGSE